MTRPGGEQWSIRDTQMCGKAAEMPVSGRLPQTRALPPCPRLLLPEGGLPNSRQAKGGRRKTSLPRHTATTNTIFTLIHFYPPHGPPRMAHVLVETFCSRFNLFQIFSAFPTFQKKKSALPLTVLTSGWYSVVKQAFFSGYVASTITEFADPRV